MDSRLLGDDVLVYRIDADDRLCEVNEAWTIFARENEGEGALPERVLGRRLWDFVRDANVTELYRRMIRRARSGHPVQFHYRCDAPEWRRLFAMTITAADESRVTFISRLLEQQQRARVALLDVTMPRGRQWVTVCSWCQRVALPEGAWVEVETAVERLGLLETDALPALTHGMCKSCRDGMLRKLLPTTAV